MAGTLQKAYNPTPSNNAVDVSTRIRLQWTSGYYAVRHQVYLDNHLVVERVFGDLNFEYVDIELEYNRTYQWFVKSFDNSNNSVDSDIWTFTTESEPPPPKAYKISEVWQSVTDFLNDNKTALGIKQAKRAETGKVASIQTPACLTWLEFNSPTVLNAGRVLSIPATITVFCLASPKAGQIDAIDESLLIASNIITQLSGQVINDVPILLSEEPMEIVERSSTSAVVAVHFNVDIPLC